MLTNIFYSQLVIARNQRRVQVHQVTLRAAPTATATGTATAAAREGKAEQATVRTRGPGLCIRAGI